MMLLTLLPLIMSATAAVVLPLEPPIPGYGITELSWEVISAPGQFPIILNGTIEQVHSQLLEINSNYQMEMPEKRVFTPIREDLVAAPTAAMAAKDVTAPTATAHSTQIWKLDCGGYDLADIKQIKDGISYLNGITGQPKNGPGPNNCGRVSCSYNSAIWWCNDDSTSPKALPGFYSIATGATKIVDTCTGGNEQSVSGIGNHPDNWKVVVKGDRC